MRVWVHFGVGVGAGGSGLVLRLGLGLVLGFGLVFGLGLVLRLVLGSVSAVSRKRWCGVYERSTAIPQRCLSSLRALYTSHCVARQ